MRLPKLIAALAVLLASITASGPDIPGKTVSGELKGAAAVDGAKESAQANLAGKVADSSAKIPAKRAILRAPVLKILSGTRGI